MCIFNDCECLVREDLNTKKGLTIVIKRLFELLKLKNDIVDVERDQLKIAELHKSIRKSNSIEIVNPKCLEEWHPTKNGRLNPRMISAYSSLKVWWIGKCGHEWESSISNKVSNHGCPYCSYPPVKLLEGFNDLQTKNPRIAAEWNYEKNKKLLPTEVFEVSGKKVWWRCEKGHEWQATIASRTKKKNGCPYCAGQRLIYGVNDIETQRPDIAKEWHPIKNEKQPRDYMIGTLQKVWWLGECGHEWEARISSRTRKNGGTNCPICAKNAVKKIKNIDTGRVYNTMQEAVNDTGVYKSGICNCCRGKAKTAGGYRWEYYE